MAIRTHTSTHKGKRGNAGARMTQREIGEALGFSKEQVSGFVNQLYARERKIAAGEALKKKGRSAKDDKYT